MQEQVNELWKRIQLLREKREDTPEGAQRNVIRAEMSRLIDRRDSLSDRLNALHRKEFYESL